MHRSFYILVFGFLLNIPGFLGQDEGKLFSRKKEPETVKELAASLTEGISNDSLKVVKIYEWITGNVSYDYPAFMSGQPIRYQSPELVFRRRKTTCTGYSNLMVALLEYSGIRAYTVEGFTQDHTLGLKTQLLSSDHAWVAFSVNGNWHVADPTWDAGNIGLMEIKKSEEVKLTFWKRLKKFKFKNLFKKKKKSITKTSTRTRVSYKMGFTRMPTMDYLFSDPNEFVKTHLPNVAHIQMRSAPISVAQFSDSVHSIGDYHYTTNGSFNFNQWNDLYYGLEVPDRLLWLSDSSLNFHSLNHGDKALNAHNYLGYFYGERTNSIDQLERMSSIADTVIIHGNIAIQINRSELKKKRTEFQVAFQAEKKWNAQQNNQVAFIRSHISRTTEIYRKGRERMQLKEVPTIDRMLDRISSYGGGALSTSIEAWKKNPTLNPLFNSIQALNDSVVKYQKIEKGEGETYLNSLSEGFYAARMAMYNNAVLHYEGVFLNERELLQSDQFILDSLTLLNKTMRDSVNSYLSNRKSYFYLLKLDQELKKQLPVLATIETQDSTFDKSEYLNYVYGQHRNLLSAEKTIIYERLSQAELIQDVVISTFYSEGKELGLDMKDLSYLKTMRQAYLTKMMNNKYNRSIKVYSQVITNAKNWQKAYRARIKSLEEIEL